MPEEDKTWSDDYEEAGVMEQTIPVNEGAEAFVELLNANDVDYIFINPGTDIISVQEAVAKFKALGKRTPEVITCLHESVAMAAAHGYFMVSGKPQVVLVHADLGPQQVGGALHNAQRGRIGVVLCSGRTPSNFEANKRSVRSNPVHWLQDQFDQAGVVRGYVKWNYELRSNDNIHHVVQRAFQVASSEPCGPVYLILPQDLLMEKITSVRIPTIARHPTVSTPQADPALLAEVASMLIEAEKPLIITSYSGRHPHSVASLVELAETLGARVINSRFSINFPTTHPLYGGFDPHPYLEDADVILIIDHDVPYIPARVKPKPDAKIIHIDIDPLKQNIPIWGFPVDVLIQADSSKAIPVLSQMISQRATPDQQARFQARLQQLKSEHQQQKEEWHHLATTKATQRPISPEWLCHCISEVIDENTIVLDEVLTNREALLHQVLRTKPGRSFESGGSSLGWGLGAALGAKLASPDSTVITLVGDGSFVFGCPTAALWAASIHHAPFLAIIFNNKQYHAPKLVLRRTYGAESFAEQTGLWVGVDIKPPPDYALISQACHAYGQMVEDPSDILPALRNALEQVQGGKPAIIDVILESP